MKLSTGQSLPEIVADVRRSWRVVLGPLLYRSVLIVTHGFGRAETKGDHSEALRSAERRGYAFAC